MSNEIIIVKGEEKPVKVYLKKPNGKPFALTGATQITFSFLNGDKSVLNKTLSTGVTIVSSDNGEVLCTLTEAETAALKSGQRQAFYIAIDVGSVKSFVLKGLELALNVMDKPF